MSAKLISIDEFKREYRAEFIDPKRDRREDLIPLIMTTAALLGGLGAVAAIGWMHGRAERLDN